MTIEMENTISARGFAIHRARHDFALYVDRVRVWCEYVIRPMTEQPSAHWRCDCLQIAAREVLHEMSGAALTDAPPVRAIALTGVRA